MSGVLTQSHINIGILQPGSEAQDTGDSRQHHVQNPYVYVVFWAPTFATQDTGGSEPRATRCGQPQR